MQELLTLLDENLVYDGHEIVDGNFVFKKFRKSCLQM